MGGLMEYHVLDWRNRSFAVTAQVEVGDAASGVMFNLGGRSGGWSFYLKHGTPTFTYNLFGIDETIIRANQPAPRRRAPAARGVRVRRRRLRQGRQRHPLHRRQQDRRRQARAHRADRLRRRVHRHRPRRPLPGHQRLRQRQQRPTGTINWVELESGHDSHDHLVDPESVLNFMMYEQ